MRPWIKALPLAWLVTVCTLSPSPAAGDVQVARWILGGGAGTFSSGDTRILASLGQAAVGQSTEASASVLAGFEEVPLPLHAPDLVALNGATVADNTPQLPWSTVYGASGYLLSWAQSPDFSAEQTVEVTGNTQYTFPTALASGTYYWRVQATHCTRVASVYSTADNFVVAAAAPPPPVNPVAATPSEEPSILPSRYVEIGVADTLDFGSIRIGDEATLELAIESIGTGTAVCQPCALMGTPSLGFSTLLESDTWISPGKHVDTDIFFTPLTVGPVSASLSLDFGTKLVEVVLVGIGLLPPPQIEVETDSLAFTAGELGDPAQRAIWVTNTGGDSLHVSLDGLTDASLTHSPSSLNLAPGDSALVTIQYLRTSLDAVLDTLLLHSDALDRPAFSIEIVGAPSLAPSMVQALVEAGFTAAGVLDVTAIESGERLRLPALDEEIALFGSGSQAIALAAADGESVSAYLEPETAFDSTGRSLRFINDASGQLLHELDLYGLGTPLSDAPVSLEVAHVDSAAEVGVVEPGETVELHLRLPDLTDVELWRVTVTFNPENMRYVAGSFLSPAGVPVTIAERDGSLTLSVEGLQSAAGTLGSLSFEFSTSMADSTDLTITEYSVSRTSAADELWFLAAPLTFAARQYTVEEKVDFDRDGTIDLSDFFRFVDFFGTADRRFDLDRSGLVDRRDLILFLEIYRQNPEANAKVLAEADQLLSGVPVSTGLEPNYPNPFNASTVIPFDLSSSGQARLEIYNAVGQMVKVLVDGEWQPGSHRATWDGTDEQGVAVSGGIYFARLHTDETQWVRKMTMVK